MMILRLSCAALFAALLVPAATVAQESPDDAVPVVRARSASGEAPVVPANRDPLDADLPMAAIEIDGLLHEDEWATAQVFTNFIQGEPVEGASVEHDTEVRFLIGDEAIWIAARMYDSEPEKIVRRMTRRDAHGDFDAFSVHLDPNLDGLTGYRFNVSAANVQADSYFYDDDKIDGAWDAVWASAVNIDDQGWTVEMRIPLSQIRYEASDEPQTWGVNFYRTRIASAETSYYSLISKLKQGRVSQMGRIDGVRVTRPSRRLEALPYVVSNFHSGPSTPGNPFFDGSATSSRVGMDLSYGLGSAFTLDATINPDFGQVEADPAVINLTAFETFFEERRPFFVEDARVFDFNLSGHRNSLFYSRRIGRNPSGRAPAGTAFSDMPDNATILGAAKLSGRTQGGLSVGALAAVTGAEQGRGLLDDGTRTEFLVEPRAEYGVVSLAQDFNGGTTQIAGITTAMRRELPGDGSFDWLPSSAFNAGLRFEHQWGDREWGLTGFLAGSHVRGSTAAITRIQRASNHYFQRPDATRFSVDPEATSITGIDWRLQFDRRSGTHWTGGVWLAQATKGFEINDLGFSQGSERLDAGMRISYREIQPGSLFRNYNVNFFTYHNWSHEALDDTWSIDSWQRARLRGSFNLHTNFQLLNYWDIRANASYSPQAMSRTATRGGPLMVDPASTNLSLNVGSDRRKSVSVGAAFSMRDDRTGSGGQIGFGTEVTFKPSDNLSLSVRPGWESSRTDAQYVLSTSAWAFAPTYDRSYLFAELERRSFSMETRLDWIFSPTLSLQLFAQPLLSSGDYVHYKQLAAPGSYDFFDMQQSAGSVVDGSVQCGGAICNVDGTQHVDFDRDGDVDYSFADRDFNFRSLIGNAVLRWEYRPGSTIFFVWQRSQADRALFGDFDFGRDAGALFDAPADNRFIVKVNWWLGL